MCPPTPTAGITLIALIITIIVMLILVGVTISVLINSNLIGATKTAAKKWQEETDKEKTIGSKIIIDDKEYESIEEYINGGKKHNWQRNGDIITCSECDATYEIGDKVAYHEKGTIVDEMVLDGSITGGTEAMALRKTYNPEEYKYDADYWKLDRNSGNQLLKKNNEFTWVILGIEDRDHDGSDETLLLTSYGSAYGADTPNYEEDQACMYGTYGYNNGIEILNDICNKFYGAEARAITPEDINSCFNFNPPDNSYNIENHKIDCMTYWWTESDGKLYLADPNTQQIAEITEKEKNVIFGENDELFYWVAGNSLDYYNNNVIICFGTVNGGQFFDGDWLWTTLTEEFLLVMFPVRPVIMTLEAPDKV